MSDSSSVPYLSVVAASRNDDHGGDPLRRTQIFIDCFARQCEALQLPAELILVDWNPVAGRPGLAGVLRLPDDSTYCTARVITVPTELHNQFKYAEKLPFLQMIAKNVGIRRARGKFVLATNIDIIFSHELMAFIGRQQLDPTRMYRVDRYDIKAGIPHDYSLDRILDYAWQNPIRSNRRFGPALLVEHLYGDEPSRKYCVPAPEYVRNFKGFSVLQHNDAWLICPDSDTPMGEIHTNACGDFTLLSAEAWAQLRGYAEFAGYSFNIDSVGVLAAHYAGFEEISLLPPCVCFHIEHTLGSGWTPEGEHKLFERLQKNRIINPEWPVLENLIERFQKTTGPLPLNTPDWGLAPFELPEEPILVGAFQASPDHPWPKREWPSANVSALKPEFDLDRLTLWHEREKLDKGGPEVRDGGRNSWQLVQLFVPNAQNQHHEDRVVNLEVNLASDHPHFIMIEDYHAGTCLRLDPTYKPGIMEINALDILEANGTKLLWSLAETRKARLGIWGTTRLLPSLPDAPDTLRILITGWDPQLWLPPLPTTQPELLVRFRMTHHPYSKVEGEKH